MTILRDGINDDSAACPQDGAACAAAAVEITPARLVAPTLCSLLQRTRIARLAAGLGRTESMSQHHVRPEANEALYGSSVRFSGPGHAAMYMPRIHHLQTKTLLGALQGRRFGLDPSWMQSPRPTSECLLSTVRRPASRKTSHSKIFLFPHFSAPLSAPSHVPGLPATEHAGQQDDIAVTGSGNGPSRAPGVRRHIVRTTNLPFACLWARHEPEYHWPDRLRLDLLFNQSVTEPSSPCYSVSAKSAPGQLSSPCFAPMA